MPTLHPCETKPNRRGEYITIADWTLVAEDFQSALPASSSGNCLPFPELLGRLLAASGPFSHKEYQKNLRL
jgi:hypothetical protein